MDRTPIDYWCLPCFGTVPVKIDANFGEARCTLCDSRVVIIFHDAWIQYVPIPDNWPAMEQDIGDINRDLIGMIGDLARDNKQTRLVSCGVRILGVTRDDPFDRPEWQPLSRFSWGGFYGHNRRICVRWRPWEHILTKDVL